MKTAISLTLALTIAAALAPAQSPPATATLSVGGKALTIKYSAPSVRGRKIFGDGGLISNDPNYPIWRAGANSATSFHTDAAITIGSLKVPAGDYTLYANVKDPDNWELVVNKETGQWGLTYNQPQDLGRVKMTMSKPASSVEVCRYTFTDQAGGKVKLELAWENHVASVQILVK